MERRREEGKIEVGRNGGKKTKRERKQVRRWSEGLRERKGRRDRKWEGHSCNKNRRKEVKQWREGVREAESK